VEHLQLNNLLQQREHRQVERAALKKQKEAEDQGIQPPQAAAAHHAPQPAAAELLEAVAAAVADMQQHLQRQEGVEQLHLQLNNLLQQRQHRQVERAAQKKQKEVEDQGIQPPQAAAAHHAPQPAAAELLEAVAAAVADIQQQMQSEEDTVQQLQMINLQQEVYRQEVRAPQPGNERPPFLVRRPVARKLFSCVSHALLSNEEALCIQLVKNCKNKPIGTDLQKSGVYEITCHTSKQKYVGQTSTDLHIRFIEHCRYIKSNNPKSAYAVNILNNQYEYGPASNTIKLIQQCNIN
jgi:hypothetical protein